MSVTSWLLTVAMLGAAAYGGALRPTGWFGRTRAEDEEERRRDAATKWLDRDER